MNKLVPGKKDL